MENIDEDIKILEELKKVEERISKNQVFAKEDRNTAIKRIKAIENLLSRLKTAERMNDVLAEHIDNYTYKGGNSSYDCDDGCDFQLQTKCICDTTKECTECIKEWARKKVEDEKDNTNN